MPLPPFSCHLLTCHGPRRLVGAFALAACCLAVQAQTDVQTLVSTGQYATALDQVDAQLAQAPRDARLIAQRAMLLSLQKRDVHALRLLDGLAARQPELAQPHHLTALILAGSGDLQGAQAAAARAVQADPAYLPARLTLGRLQARQSRQTFEQALRLDPRSAELRDRVAALTAAIGSDPVGPGAAPFAQPGALVALAPPRSAVAPPGSGAIAEATATARVADNPNVYSFDRAASAAPAQTVFLGVPDIALRPGPDTARAGMPAAVPVATPAGTPALASAAQAEVSAALREWAGAWSRRDVAAYLAAYMPGFEGGARSREAWERERRERIVARAHIQVELSEVVITFIGDRAETRFRQRYVSDTVNSVNRKLLYWQRMPGGGWRISKETVEG